MKEIAKIEETGGINTEMKEEEGNEEVKRGGGGEGRKRFQREKKGRDT